MQEFDIHKGKVKTETAISYLEDLIKRNRKIKINFFAVIVGYGSTGGTHKIKTASLEYLENALENNKIRNFLQGSECNIFSNKYQKLDSKYKKDITGEMKSRSNPGIIYIWV